MHKDLAYQLHIIKIQLLIIGARFECQFGFCFSMLFYILFRRHSYIYIHTENPANPNAVLVLQTLVWHLTNQLNKIFGVRWIEIV